MPVYHGTTTVTAIYHGETAVTPQVALPVLSWTPGSISSSLYMWLDASVVSSQTVVSGGVSEWRDQSGNGRHATQANPTVRPVRSVLSAQNAIRFDGTNDFMTIPLLPAADIGSFDIFVVALSTLVGRGDAFAGQAGVLRRYADIGSPAGSYFVGYDASGRIGVTHHLTAGENAAGGVRGPASGVISTSPQLLHWGYDEAGGSTSAARWAMRIDGGGQVAETTTTSSSGWAAGGELGRLTTGQNTFFGVLAEVIATSTGLSTADRERVEGYLSHKWRFTDRLPALHPYKTSPP